MNSDPVGLLHCSHHAHSPGGPAHKKPELRAKAGQIFPGCEGVLATPHAVVWNTTQELVLVAVVHTGRCEHNVGSILSCFAQDLAHCIVHWAAAVVERCAACWAGRWTAAVADHWAARAAAVVAVAGAAVADDLTSWDAAAACLPAAVEGVAVTASVPHRAAHLEGQEFALASDKLDPAKLLWSSCSASMSL